MSVHTGCSVAPYAVSSPDWIERIVNSHWHWNERADNVPTTTHQPSYINIAADGSPNLPPHMQEIALEFEQLYENTHYKTLQPCGRRRTHAGAVDDHGNPVYDRLLRGICATAACQGNRYSQELKGTAASKKEHKKRHSVDLGEIRRFSEDLQGDVFHRGMTEMGTWKQGCWRPFSVDLCQTEECIAVKSTKETNSTLADQPE